MTETIVHIGTGQGPAECEWVAGKLATEFAREAAAAGLDCELIEGSTDGAPAILLRIAGTGSEAFATARCGTIRWIGTSPFRPMRKRRNWFVGVSLAPQFDEIPELRDEDIRYQSLRASGPGGQHVNKTDSAVRATHVPTGLTSFSQDQRSQWANRKIARLKLALALFERGQQAARDGKQAMWSRNRELERGNAVRTYEGEKFGLR